MICRFHTIRGTFWGSHNKDYCILGFILYWGPLFWGNYHMQITWRLIRSSSMYGFKSPGLYTKASLQVYTLKV